MRVFELVLAKARGWRFVALFELDVRHVVGVEAGRDDGLGVVHVEDEDRFFDYVAGARIIDFHENVFAVLERGWGDVGLGPPVGRFAEVNVAGDEALIDRWARLVRGYS